MTICRRFWPALVLGLLGPWGGIRWGRATAAPMPAGTSTGTAATARFVPSRTCWRKPSLLVVERMAARLLLGGPRDSSSLRAFLPRSGIRDSVLAGRIDTRRTYTSTPPLTQTFCLFAACVFRFSDLKQAQIITMAPSALQMENMVESCFPGLRCLFTSDLLARLKIKTSLN